MHILFALILGVVLLGFWLAGNELAAIVVAIGLGVLAMLLGSGGPQDPDNYLHRWGIVAIGFVVSAGIAWIPVWCKRLRASTRRRRLQKIAHP